MVQPFPEFLIPETSQYHMIIVVIYGDIKLLLIHFETVNILTDIKFGVNYINEKKINIGGHMCCRIHTCDWIRIGSTYFRSLVSEKRAGNRDSRYMKHYIRLRWGVLLSISRM